MESSGGAALTTAAVAKAATVANDREVAVAVAAPEQSTKFQILIFNPVFRMFMLRD